MERLSRMNIGIIGGTGFVGSYLVDALIAAGHHPVLLVRPGSESKVRNPQACTLISGDVAHQDALKRLVSHCTAIIYNIGILREFPARGVTFEALQLTAVEQTIELAKAQGVKRFLLMSANGVRADGTPYQRSKFQAEEYLRASGLDWTIFRPSVIFGDPRGRMEFATQLNKEIIQAPLPAPLFFTGLNPMNAGQFKLSPVHVSVVANAFVDALENPQSIGTTYPLCGPEALRWRDILTRIAQATGKRKYMLPAPVIGVKIAATLFDRFAFFPVTRDQLTMLLEGNTCATAPPDTSAENPAFNQQTLQYL